MKKDLTNQFFDINKLPKERGLLIFPISMSRIGTGQSAEKCLKFIKYFSPSKVSAPNIGLNFIYGDFLYLSSDEPANKLKRLFIDEILKHKNQMQKLLQKNNLDFQIQHAFNFQTWSDLYLDSKSFKNRYMELRRIYNKDKLFQRYVKEDVAEIKKELTENQIEFFLEEHLLMYLITKGETRLRNDYIQDFQNWILMSYPGKPPKHLAYLYQLNPFKLDNQKNKYQNCFYDLESKKLYDFERLDLDTWNYE